MPAVIGRAELAIYLLVGVLVCVHCARSVTRMRRESAPTPTRRRPQTAPKQQN